jgi:hypothetical protein
MDRIRILRRASEYTFKGKCICDNLGQYGSANNYKTTKREERKSLAKNQKKKSLQEDRL